MSDPIPPTEAPVPPVPTTSPTVAKDIEADAAGEARDLTPTPPPPGTIEVGFWGNDATKGAIGSTLVIGMIFLRAFILAQPVSREAVAVAADFAFAAWLLAFGIHKTSDALRYK